MINMGNVNFKRNQIIWTDLGQDGKGSEHKGVRPAYVISNNIGNNKSNIVKVAIIGTKQHQVDKKKSKLLPTQFVLKKEETGLEEDSIFFAEQVRTISKERVKGFVGQVTNKEIINQVNRALMVADGIIEI